MESSLMRKSLHGGKLKNGIMKLESSDDESGKEDKAIVKESNNIVKMESSSFPEANMRIASSASQRPEDRLASTKEEMEKMIQENQRLRMHLDKVMKDYQTLQKQFNDILQQEATLKSPTSNNTHTNTEEPHDDLVSLSLGRTSSIDMKKVDNSIFAPNKVIENKADHEKEGLDLELSGKFKTKINQEILGESSSMSAEKSIEEVIREEGGQTWQANNNNPKRNVEEEISPQNPAKRARVSLRVRCDSPTMNDGCQWRKYGQKIAKGNPCPRAYYRCTVAANCPVRKQVQRCAEDMSILITTYEGTHNHPLPVAATAIASTTSAAARMLLSGSSTSSSNPNNTSDQHSNVPSTNINGLNYYFSADNSKSKPFYLPNSSISSSASAFPTITLDLTSTSSSSSFSPLNRMASFPPRFPSTNLNFNSTESNMLPISWSNGSPFNNTNQMNSLNFQRQPFNQDNIYQPYTFKNMSYVPSDTLAEATKAITSNPDFQSALAVALSSIIGSSGKSNNNLESLRIRDQSFPILSSFASTQNASNCSSDFLNMNPSNSQSGSAFSLHPSSQFPVPKSKSTSPDDSKDHTP